MEDAPVNDIQEPEEKFSLKAFTQGMLCVALIYAIIGGWIWGQSEKTTLAQTQRLASKTVIIQWPEKSPMPDSSGGAENSNADAAAPKSTVIADLPVDTAMLESGLADAPIQGLFEDTSLGKLPVIRSDGLTSFKAYRRPFDRQLAGNKPLIAIVIAGLGLSDQATETALRKMPPEVTFAISPYTASPDFWVREARLRGHEIWMTLPLESAGFPQVDPGPHTMMIGVPERDNTAKLSWLLTRASGYVGFITDQNSTFMNSILDMRPVVGSILSHGLALADNAENSNAIAATMAHGMDAPYTAIDIWIDETATQENIRASLEQLEKRARAQGVATGVIRALPVSYQEISRWLGTLEEKGFVLAPLSAQAGQ